MKVRVGWRTHEGGCSLDAAAAARSGCPDRPESDFPGGVSGRTGNCYRPPGNQWQRQHWEHQFFKADSIHTPPAVTVDSASQVDLIAWIISQISLSCLLRYCHTKDGQAARREACAVEGVKGTTQGTGSLQVDGHGGALIGTLLVPVLESTSQWKQKKETCGSSQYSYQINRQNKHVK